MSNVKPAQGVLNIAPQNLPIQNIKKLATPEK